MTYVLPFSRPIAEDSSVRSFRRMTWENQGVVNSVYKLNGGRRRTKLDAFLCRDWKLQSLDVRHVIFAVMVFTYVELMLT